MVLMSFGRKRRGTKGDVFECPMPPVLHLFMKASKRQPDIKVLGQLG
jgi:hypothetical protein